MLHASNTRNHTIGTTFIATVNHIHPSGNGAIATGFGNVFDDMDGFSGDNLVSVTDLFE